VISLAHPAYLLVGAFFLVPYAIRRQRALQFSCVRLLHSAQHRNLVTRLVTGLIGLGCVLLLIALARPLKGSEHTQQLVEKRNILLTLDLSLSMEGYLEWRGAGTPPTKLELVRDAALKFVRQQQHDRLGLIVFGDDAFGVWPLSTDSTVMQQRLQRLDALLPAALRGTYVARAVEKSLDHFAEMEDSASKILLLLTDGLDTIEAAVVERLAQRLTHGEVKLYVLGMGLDESTSIVQLARRVQGEYFNINNAEELTKALQDIDQQARAKILLNRETESQELYPFFALPGLVMLLLGTLVKATWVWEV
jgi:Ca-activated chloride channel family protein